MSRYSCIQRNGISAGESISICGPTDSEGGTNRVSLINVRLSSQKLDKHVTAGAGSSGHLQPSAATDIASLSWVQLNYSDSYFVVQTEAMLHGALSRGEN
jgi:hypothetical protein